MQVNWSLWQKRCYGHGDLVRQGIVTVQQDLPQHLAVLSTSIAAQQWDVARAEVHTLIGMLTFCGLPDLECAMQDLQHVLRHAQSPAAVQENWSRVQQQAEQVLHRLASPLRLIILDRDGVINHDSPDFIRTPDQWQPIEGSIAAIAALKKAGYLVAVATNQSGVGRGLYTEETLAAMHARFADLLAQQGEAIDALVYCPHLPTDDCVCRKPRPGMIQQLLTQFGVLPEEAVVVGDSLRDLQAGWTCGVSAVLVRTGNGQKSEAALPSLESPLKMLWWGGSQQSFENLATWVQFLLK